MSYLTFKANSKRTIKLPLIELFNNLMTMCRMYNIPHSKASFTPKRNICLARLQSETPHDRHLGIYTVCSFLPHYLICIQLSTYFFVLVYYRHNVQLHCYDHNAFTRSNDPQRTYMCIHTLPKMTFLKKKWMASIIQVNVF